MFQFIFNNRILFFLVLFVFSAQFAAAQTTEFTYQGKITDAAGTAASYDFEFRLFSIDTNGTALATNQRLGVPVSNGVFSVRLDFGTNFNGQPRWLEIAVKPAGSGTFATLLPRQPLTSAPYSIRSLSATTADTSANSTLLGGLTVDQFVQTNDSRLVDARNPLPGSGNYIQNGTSPQLASNFNIAGDGTVGGTLAGNTINSATQYNIGGNRVLTVTGSANTFSGIGAGANSTGENNSFFGRNTGGGTNNSGSSNSFFGERAGGLNTTGFANSFFGSAAGVSNTAGRTNSFFGVQAGQSNTTGNDNSFFGVQAGFANTTGVNNSFFGRGAGNANTIGDYNSFFGFEAGMSNTIPGGNSFFGANAGRANTTGLFNSFFGYNAGRANVTGQYNSFFGYGAGAVSTGEGNTFFGSLAGSSNTTANANTFFGTQVGEDNTTGSRNTFFGRWAGKSNTTGTDNVFVGFNSGLLNKTGTKNVFIGVFAGSFENGDNLTIIGSNAGVPNGLTLQYATAIGADAEVSSSNTVQLGRANGFDTVFAPGLIRVGGLGAAGSTNLCRNASNLIATCSSSLRYKTNVQTFSGGLDIVRRLRPITFDWRADAASDIGFAAEEVNAIEPLLTTRNARGEIEGVKYAQISTVLVNALNEQQTEIKKQNAQILALEKQILEQQLAIESLKKLVCRQIPRADFCQAEIKTANSKIIK